MRNPGIAKDYFTLTELGCSWSLELRTFMLVTIAGKLKLDPRGLPRMTDDQLWVSFKTAVGTGDAALLPNVFIEHRDLVHSLSIGETSAITIGRYLDTPALPEGKTFGELAEYAGLDLSDKKNMLYGALVISVTNSILATIEHPALINWELRAQRYPSAVGKCT